MRIIIVQYAGDYREAVYRFAAGQGETYHAQRYSVNSVAALTSFAEEVAVLCCITESPYNEKLPNGVRAIGAGCQHPVDFKAIIQQIEAYQPTHLILNIPSREILNWAIKRQLPTITCLADSFNSKNWRQRLRNFQLVRALNHPQIQWVANHGITASESLCSIGVNPNKIIPWDWPYPLTPDAFSAKTLFTGNEPRTLVYVGLITEAKGVGDALEAVALLRSKNVPVTLKLAGKGDLEVFQQKAATLNITDAVEFLGLVDNKSIIPLMRSADLVLVPSRHDYPEGFPLTIYEALCSRTPIVASDHPMFVRQLRHRVNAMLFPAGQPQAIAGQIEAIFSDAALYSQISEATAATWHQLQLPVKMGDLLARWVNTTPENQQWLYQHRLTSGLYKQQPISQTSVQLAEA
ncbi:glycosyltransferase [Leptolyngbya sp. NK1-12]|uniref:Glycosyltransferase n=1 Tax=Leptolyngbya sp. NK1-12 TaxID=2547451 RepID=A0AA97APF6_9CYAN|nr:glycosyltransferase [Leptolyngbya sp. NK1-12]WNZ21483.1 glycosyltransferase [Leptolyngbya sp. NK1-12]